MNHWPSASSSFAPLTLPLTPTSKPTRLVFVLGGPCSGKTTMSGRLASEYGFVHLQAGDLLRDERLKANATSALIEQHIAAGQPVTVDVTVGLLRAAIDQWRARGSHVFLFDGFPRNQSNLDGWNRGAPDIKLALALFLDAPEQVMEARCIKRASTGAQSARAEDAPAADAIKRKFLQFVTTTQADVRWPEKSGSSLR